MHFVYIYIVLTALQNNVFVFVFKYDLETKFFHLIWILLERKVRVIGNSDLMIFTNFHNSNCTNLL